MKHIYVFKKSYTFIVGVYDVAFSPFFCLKNL